jgi:phage terminase small subunit
MAGRPPTTAETKLTPKQARFVREYLRDHNGLQVAIRAGYSKHGAAVTASQTLMRANVAAAIDREMAKWAERNDVTLDLLIAEAETARKLAMRLGQSSAAVQSVAEVLT